MIAVSTRTITRSRYTSCGQNGTPGWTSVRSGPYSRGNPGRPSNTPSLRTCGSMGTSVGLSDALDPHQGHVDDHEEDADEGEDEHVEPIHPQDIEACGVRLPERDLRQELPEPHGAGRRLRHVDPDGGSGARQIVGGEAVSRVPGAQRDEHDG